MSVRVCCEKAWCPNHGNIGDKAAAAGALDPELRSDGEKLADSAIETGGPADAAREELSFIVSYLAHNDQDANHAWMVRRIRAVLAGKDPSLVQGWNEYDGVRAPRGPCSRFPGATCTNPAHHDEQRSSEQTTKAEAGGDEGGARVAVDGRQVVAAEGAPDVATSSDQATGPVQAGAYDPGSASAPQPSISDIESQRDAARNELARLINFLEARNATHACSGEWETCWCDTCEARRKFIAEYGTEHDGFDIVGSLKPAAHAELR